MQPAIRRGVNSADKSSLRNYCTKFYTKCTEHKLFNIYKNFQTLTTLNYKLAESINKQLDKFISHADKKYIKKYKNLYNVELKNTRTQFNLHRLYFCYLKNNIDLKS